MSKRYDGRVTKYGEFYFTTFAIFEYATCAFTKQREKDKLCGVSKIKSGKQKSLVNTYRAQINTIKTIMGLCKTVDAVQAS